MLAWLQPGQASAPECEDDFCPPQQEELHHRALPARSCGLLGHQPALPTLGLALANNRARQLVRSIWVIQSISSYFPFRHFQGESQVFAPVFSHVKKRCSRLPSPLTLSKVLALLFRQHLEAFQGFVMPMHWGLCTC